MTAIASHWMDRDTLETMRSHITDNVYKWLVLSHNITETIKKTGIPCSLNLLSQAFNTPYPDEVYALKPYAVDVSSGVENAPGKKDKKLLKAFFEAGDLK